MISTDWLLIILVLLVQGGAMAALLVPVTIALAPRLGFLAHPGGRHIHSRPTPTLGGLAITGGVVLTILLNLALAWFFRDALETRWPGVGVYFHNIPDVINRLGVVVIGALAMSVLGLVDDRFSLGPRTKLMLMIAIASMLPLAGIRIQGFLPWPWLGGIATVAWVVFLINSFNFLDNMDGLCAGLAAIAALAFAIISLIADQWFIAAIFAVLAGSLLGFLPFNFHRARLFMGDNGSLFVGFMIGALSVMPTYYQRGVPTVFPVLTPILVLGVPIFDTVSVMWIRWRSGRPLMHGDTSHFSHRLRDLGMPIRRAVTFIYIVAAAVALGAVALPQVNAIGAMAILAQAALLFWIIYRLERTGHPANSIKS